MTGWRQKRGRILCQKSFEVLTIPLPRASQRCRQGLTQHKAMLELVSLTLPSCERCDNERRRYLLDTVKIFVADEVERHRYVTELGPQWPHIVVGTPTLWKQRNFITEYFKEGSHVVSLDDDVEEIFRLKGD